MKGALVATLCKLYLANISFTLWIESKQIEGSNNPVVLCSKVNLIDLAGSESGNSIISEKEKKKKQEMTNINQSLLTLTQVIRLLSENSKAWIPYRDSKLTMYLKDSLEDARISIICNMVPYASAYKQSKSTLAFAKAAKNIKQRAKINEKLEGDNTLIITKLQENIKALKIKLSQIEKNQGNTSYINKINVLEVQLNTTEKEKAELEKKLNKYESYFSCSQLSKGAKSASMICYQNMPENFREYTKKVLENKRKNKVFLL